MKRSLKLEYGAAIEFIPPDIADPNCFSDAIRDMQVKMNRVFFGDPVDKSRKLLVDNLTPVQLKEFETSDGFTVEIGGEAYRIEPNIVIRKRDNCKFCVVYPGLPVYDQMLARKLDLEHQPELFFKIANVFTERGFRRQQNYRDIALLPILLRRAMEHECRKRYMDPRLLDVHVGEELAMRGGYHVDVRYAREYACRGFIEYEHFLNANFQGVIESISQYLIQRIDEYVTIRVREGR